MLSIPEFVFYIRVWTGERTHFSIQNGHQSNLGKSRTHPRPTRRRAYSVITFWAKSNIFNLWHPFLWVWAHRGSKYLMPLDRKCVVSYTSIIHFGVKFLTVIKLSAILFKKILPKQRWLPFCHLSSKWHNFGPVVVLVLLPTISLVANMVTKTSCQMYQLDTCRCRQLRCGLILKRHVHWRPLLV